MTEEEFEKQLIERLTNIESCLKGLADHLWWMFWMLAALVFVTALNK